MRNLLSLLFALGFTADLIHGQEQFHREVKLRKRVRRLRQNRQIFEEPNQRYAAEAVEDALRNEQGSQLLIQHLATQLRQSGQTQTTSPGEEVRAEGVDNAVTYVDQYGRSVSETSQAPTQLDQNPVVGEGVRYVDQYGRDVEGPVQLSQQSNVPQPRVRVAQTPAQRAQVQASQVQQIQQQVQPQVQQVQQIQQVQPQIQQFHQQVQPQVQHIQHVQQIQQQAIHYVDQYGRAVQNVNVPHQIHHEVGVPTLQQFVSPQGLVLQHAPPHLLHQHQQFLLPQPSQVIHEAAPAVQQLVFQDAPQLLPAFPQQFAQPQYLSQLVPQQLHFQPQIPIPFAHPAPLVKKLIASPAPVVPLVKKVVAPPPIVKKAVVPVVAVKAVPEVHILKQPVLPPAVFQKQIFALKNPPVRVLTYSDLCTVYPYQRKLAGCVLKKASIPGLHHPDIQQVSEQSSSSSSNQATEIKADAKQTSTSSSGQQAVENIQAILDPYRKGETGSVLPLDDDGISVVQSNEESAEDTVSVAAPSNKNVNQVAVASKVSRALVAAKTTTAAPVTTSSPTTTTTPSTITTTSTRKPKSKRRRSSSKSGGSKRTTTNGGRRKGRKGSRKTNSTSTTTTEAPFKLA